MLLLASVWILHATMPQKQIAFIPAASDVIKVRPASTFETVSKVVSLEEAEKRYITRWGHELPDPYGNYDESGCWLGDCDFEFIVKYHLRSIIWQLIS